MIKSLKQLQTNDLVWNFVKFGHFELTSGEDVYLRYQMKGLSKFLVDAEDGSWTIQPGSIWATSHVVKDRADKVVATVLWAPFKKAQLVLEDGRVLRLKTANYGVIIMDNQRPLVVSSEEREAFAARAKRYVTLGPNALNYPELPFLIPLCNYLANQAMKEQGQMSVLAPLCNMGWSKFE